MCCAVSVIFCIKVLDTPEQGPFFLLFFVTLVPVVLDR